MSCNCNKCTCSDKSVTYKSYNTYSSDCGCDNDESCCVETDVSCVDYDGPALSCIGIVDATTTKVTLQSVLTAIDERLCSIAEDYEACCAESDLSYDLSNLTFACLTDPEELTLEAVLQVMIEGIEARTWTFDEDEFVQTDNDCAGIGISLNTGNVAQNVTNYIINNYLTEIINNLDYKTFSDEDCVSESIADGILVDSSVGLSIEKKCLPSTEFVFTLNSTSIAVDVFTGYIAPNGIVYTPASPIALNDEAAIIAWFADNLGLTVTIDTYVSPNYVIRVTDFGDATYAPKIKSNLATVNTTSTHGSLTSDSGTVCCKILFNYTAPEVETCCDDCPTFKTREGDGICLTPTVVNKVTIDTGVALSVPYDSKLNSITIMGMTYTPSTPIEFNDQTAIEAFLATINEFEVTADYTGYSPIVVITINGFAETTIVNSDQSFINYDLNDGFTTFLDQVLNFDNLVVDTEQECIIFKADVCAEDVGLTITYATGYSGDLQLKRTGNILYILGGTISKDVGTASPNIGDGTTTFLFELQAGLESINRSHSMALAPNITERGNIKVLAGETKYFTTGFSGAVTDDIEIPNMTIFLS